MPAGRLRYSIARILRAVFVVGCRRQAMPAGRGRYDVGMGSPGQDGLGHAVPYRIRLPLHLSRHEVKHRAPQDRLPLKRRRSPDHASLNPRRDGRYLVLPAVHLRQPLPYVVLEPQIDLRLRRPDYVAGHHLFNFIPLNLQVRA